MVGLNGGSHRFVQTLLSLNLRNLSLSPKKKKKFHPSNLRLVIIIIIIKKGYISFITLSL